MLLAVRQEAVSVSPTKGAVEGSTAALLTAAAIRARASSLAGRSVVVWVALGAAIIGTVVVLALTLPNSDNEPSGTAASNQRSQPLDVNTRFDGGPNEGTRGQ
jgi:hypothetical protein